MKKLILMTVACLLATLTFAAQCEGKTKKGERCKREAAEGSKYCLGHADQAKSEKLKDDGTCWAVTEAGTRIPGTVRSSVAIGILLSEGIGDTVRVSLTAKPEKEVKVALEILRSLGLRALGPAVTSCPTCGRTKVDLVRVASQVEDALETLAMDADQRAGRGGAGLPKVAVMGCAVNGPGEAKDADIALCGGDGGFVLYVKGEPVGKVTEEEAVGKVVEHALHLR